MEEPKINYCTAMDGDEDWSDPEPHESVFAAAVLQLECHLSAGDGEDVGPWRVLVQADSDDAPYPVNVVEIDTDDEGEFVDCGRVPYTIVDVHLVALAARLLLGLPTDATDQLLSDAAALNDQLLREDPEVYNAIKLNRPMVRAPG
jgi:hypothetical protein